MSVPILSEWLAPEAVGASLQREGVVEVGPTKREKMKNFMALKNKIVKTDELIVRYQVRARECEQYKGRLAGLEQANTGLRAELQVLHKENGGLKLSLQTVQQQLLELEENRRVDEVMIQQLTAQVEKLRTELRMELRTERIAESHREKTEEKDRWLRQYQSLRRQFEAYKQVHAKATLRPARQRRTSDASTTSSLATVSSPGYIPVFQNSPMSIFSLPDTMEGHVPLEDLLGGEPSSSTNDGEGDITVVSAGPGDISCPEDDMCPEDPPPAEPQNGNLNLLPAPSSCHDYDPAVPQDTSTSAVQLSMEANRPPTTDNGEDSSDDALSVSDSSSVCSDSSLDGLADYLNSSQETAGATTSSVHPSVPDSQKLALVETSTHSPVVLACESLLVGLQSNPAPRGTEGVLLDQGSAVEWRASHREGATAVDTRTVGSRHPQEEPVPELMLHVPSTCNFVTDSSISEENDLDDIDIALFLEVDGFLSPLPFSPHRTLQTLSPLPPTPVPRASHHISPPFLSPIALREPTISPLPPTPSRDENSIQQLPAHPNPLPQFADNAPMGLHIPKPFVAVGSSPSRHKLACKQLRLSESSLFSPPFDSADQATLGLSGKRLSVPPSEVAFEATSLELHCQLREEMKQSQDDRKKTAEALSSDRIGMVQEAVTTPTQEMNAETSAKWGEQDSQDDDSSITIPPSAVGSAAIVDPMLTTSKDIAMVVGLFGSDSDTEEGEILGSDGEEEEVFHNSKGNSEIVDKGEEESEILDEGEEETVDSAEEGEVKRADGGEEEVVDNGGEEGEIVDEEEKDEMVDGGQEETVDRREEKGEDVGWGEMETIDSGRADEKETIDSGRADEKETIGSGRADERETIDSGRADEEETIDSGRADEKETIDSGRADEKETIDSGRADEKETIGSGRADERETIDSGRADERETIDSGRADEKETIDSGRADEKETIDSGRADEKETIDRREETVDSGGEEKGEIIDKGEETVDSGGEEEGEIIDKGEETVDSGGEEEGEIIDKGEETVDSGGEEEGEIVDKGEETVDSGGEEEGEIVDKGEETVDSGGEEEGEIVVKGEETVGSGGEEEGEIIDRGDETVDSGGEEEGEIIDRGDETANNAGEETVDSGGEEEVDGRERIVGNHEEGEVVGTVTEEKREVVDSEREEESWAIGNKGEHGTSTGSEGEGSQGTERRSARLQQGRTEDTFSQLIHPAYNLRTGRKKPRGPLSGLPQQSRVGGRRASCEKVSMPPRKKQRMEEPPPCQSPPALEATPENVLPGYRLRSRCVNFWQASPKRRRLSSSESKDDSPPPQKVMKVAPPESARDTGNPSEYNPNPLVRTRTNSEKLPVNDVPAAVSEGAETESEELTLDNGPAATSVRDLDMLTLVNNRAVTSVRTRRGSEKLPVDSGAVGTKRSAGKLLLDNRPATTCKKAKKGSVKLPVDSDPAVASVRTRSDSEKLPFSSDPAVASVRTKSDSEKLPFSSDPAATRRDSEKLPFSNDPAATRRDSEKLPFSNDPAATRRDSEKLPFSNDPAATRRDSEKLPFSNDPAATRRDSEKLPFSNDPAATRRDSEKLPFSNDPAATRRDSEKLPFSNDPAATRSDSEKLPFSNDPAATRRDSEKLPFSNDPAATRRDSEKLPFSNDPAATRRDSENLPVDSDPAATSMLGKGDSQKLPVGNGILVTPQTQASKNDVEATKSPSSAQKPDDVLLGASPWMGVDCSGVEVGSGKQARQTDRATGQEEDRTPASSPRNREMGQRSNGSQQPTASQQIIGDLQLPFNTSTPQMMFPLPPRMHPPPAPGTSTSTSLVQQQLTVCMQCPLPLPLWLVNAMSKVQSCGAHNPAPSHGLKNKKRGNPRDPIHRQKKQMPFHYAVVNLERLMCGHLFLSTAIAMFSDHWNIPSPADLIPATIEYLTQCYNPQFEQVVTLYHQLCDNVRANPRQVDPLHPAFPPALLRQECQFVALFAHICRTNGSMTHLLPELTKALHQAILAQGMKFHRLAALCRLFTAMCRLQGEHDRVLFLCFDLVRKPLGPNEYPLFPGIGSIWPRALSRRVGVRLVERNQVLPLGLEEQPLTYTLEFIVVSMFRKQGDKTQESLLKNMHILCKWSQVPTPVTSLVRALVEVLKASQKVYIDSPPPGQIPWRRPRPSALAFHTVHCLRLLTWHQGWVWTNDVLIRAHLWPLLQQWNSSADSVREATIVCTMRLIGFIGQLGVSQDPQSSSIAQLQRVLIALLQQSTSKKEVSLPIQLAAADSLLELCPPSHTRAQEAMTAINTWLGTQCRQPAGMVLAQEFNSRLQPYLHV